MQKWRYKGLKKKLSLFLALVMALNVSIFDASAITNTGDNGDIAGGYDIVADTADNLTTNEKANSQTVLDISHGPIKITNTSIAGKAPGGAAVTLVNPNGYEIRGTTKNVANIVDINTTLPVTIKNVDVQLASGKPFEINNSTLNIEGTNTIRTNDNNEPALGTNGNATIKGSGTLNASAAAKGAAIGVKAWASTKTLTIEGNVTINASGNEAAAIGGGVQGNGTVIIKGNAVVNAVANTVGAAIGGGGTGTTKPGSGTVTISENAVVTATGGAYGGAAIGGGSALSATGGSGTVTINGGTVYIRLATQNLVSRQRGGGIGIAGVGTGTTGTSLVNVNSIANIDGPIDERYKAIDGTTSVYKTRILGLTPNKEVTILYKGKTGKVKTNRDGVVSLYVPVGEFIVNIDSIEYRTTVRANNLNVIGTVPVTTLDLSKGSITITDNSVTGKAPDGSDVTTVNEFGYNITTSTTGVTNTISVSGKVPITINDINATTGGNPIINMLNGGIITVRGNNILNTSSGGGAAIQALEGTTLEFIGDGSITGSSSDSSPVIGGVGAKQASSGHLIFSESVKINVTSSDRAAAIGAAYAGGFDSGYTKVTINDDASVEATSTRYDTTPAIGSGVQHTAAGNTQGKVEITINSGNLKATNTGVENTGGRGNGIGLSPWNNNSNNADLGKFIVNGGSVELGNHENKAKLDDNTRLYKSEVSGLQPNEQLTVINGNKKFTAKANAAGKAFFYLPVGKATIDVNGTEYTENIADNNNNILKLNPTITKADIKPPVNSGLKGVDISVGTASTSIGAITYKLKDAGTTGATLTGNILKWKDSGTAIITLNQAATSSHVAASKEFRAVLELAPNESKVEVTIPPVTDSNGQVVNAGSVKMTDVNGNELIVGEIGSSVNLISTANAGYKLEKWIKVDNNAPFNSKAIKAEVGYHPKLNIIVESGVTYEAHFAPIPVITSGPEIRDIRYTQAEGRELIRADGSYTPGFTGDIAGYTLNLRSVDTKSIVLTLRAENSADTVTIDGTQLTRDTAAGRQTYFMPYTLDNLTNQEINIVLTRGTQTTTYKIKVMVAADVAADPHLYGELSSDKKAVTSQIGIYGVNTDVVTATIKFNLKDFGTGATNAFEGFSNTAGTVFQGGTTNLGGDTQNYIDLHPLFKITEMRSNGQWIEIGVEPKNISDTFVTLGAIPVKIMTVSLKNNTAYTGKLPDVIKALEVDTANAFAETMYYGTIRDTTGTTAELEKATYSYLEFSVLSDFIRMSINHDSAESRATFEVRDSRDNIVNNGTSENIITDREILYEIFADRYKVKIIANGYLTVETQNFEYNGTPSANGIIFKPITLLEGDINGDNNINTDDRTKILLAFNQRVATNGSGFVRVGSEDIYGDFNNDNRINSLDLGRLITNIGKSYGTISPR